MPILLPIFVFEFYSIFYLLLPYLADVPVRYVRMGVASHGIGTAHAFQKSRVAGAFAALAMALNGLLTALLLPALTGLIR